ncbi:MAG: adenylate/guanylate cyclase domain-containing protein [bacterium]
MRLFTDEDVTARSKFGNKLFFSFILLALTLLVLYVFPFSKLPLTGFELELLDEKFLERDKSIDVDSSNIVILEISQDSYDQIIPPLNRWPWQRSFYAKVIDNLMAAGASAIGIDLLMADPDQYSASNDSLLVNAIKRSGKVVLAGQIDVPRERVYYENNSDYVELLSQGIQSLVFKKSENFSNIFFKFDSSLGIVNVPSDQDGVCRRYMPYIYSGLTSRKIPSFGFAVINKFLSIPPLQVVEVKGNSFELANFSIPKFNASSALLNFYCSGNCFRMVKFIDVLDDSSFITKDERDLNVSINTWDDREFGLKYSGLFKNKIVLIGSTMPEDKDIVPIPSLIKNSSAGNFIYGVEFHALAISNFLNRLFIKKMPEGFEISIVAFLFMSFFFIPFAFRNLSFIKRIFNEIIILVFVVVIIYIIYIISHRLFIGENYYLPVINPALGITAGYLTNIVFSYLESRRQNVFIRKSFSRYVDKEIVDEIIKNPSLFKLGGERRVVTVLFADMRDFTKIAEGKQPAELVNFVNRFFCDLSDIVTENKGMIDKFIGDAIMAVWGAPLRLENHAYLACKSALEMLDKIETSVYTFENGEKYKIAIRIGINTGEAIVGNFGGDKRFDYTVMGDSVNIAARLEELNKNYDTSNLISASTFALVKENFNAREVDQIVIRGRSEPTRIYELTGMKNSI